MQAHTDRHLGRATTGRKSRVEEHVPRHGHRIGEVPVDLVQDVLGRPAEEDRARLGLLALGEEGEVLVADLLDVEQPALGADVRLAQVLDPVDDRSADGARDPVVVRFAHAADGRDVRLVEEVLGVIFARSCNVETPGHACVDLERGWTYLRHPFL